MGLRWGLLLIACGCRSLLGFEDPTDLPPPPVDQAPDETPVFCYGNYRRVCLLAEPTTERVISENFDTGSSDCEPTVTDDNGFCVLSGTSVTVSGVVRGVGFSRPLVLIATTGIEGTLDLSSKRIGNKGGGSGAGDCPPPTAPIGSGGGAGGSLGGLGGFGGSGIVTGGGGAPSPVVVAPGEVHGGCAGSDGAGLGGTGGTGGGAALMIAPAISVPGTLLALGAGGNGGTTLTNAAGGGGSGGMLVFDASSISLSGIVQANGGGGGEGALNSDGNDGQDPVFPNVALGGAGASTAGGDGGDGSSGGIGGNGLNASSNAGGGGGGGGAGIIRVTSSVIASPSVSPTPTL